MGDKDPSVSVVMPAKNEAANIGDLVLRLRSLEGVDEVIVVDDGSSDATGKLAEDAGARVIFHPYSKGNGAAVKSGARAATSPWILFMDADGQHLPEEVEKLKAKAREGFDLVVGSRSRGQQAGLGRAGANWFYNRISSLVVGHRVLDLTSGMRMVRRAAFLRIIDLLPNGFSYPTTSTMLFYRIGYNVTYVPVQVAQRVGKSHIKPLQDGLRFLLIIFKVATLYSPLKLFFPLAGVHFLAGLARYAYTYFHFHSFTNMSALLMSAGIIIFLMGLLSEQLTSLSMLSLNEEKE